tara:strand:+ start:742 stop:1005 length:264 start_codon:yes stop_codon:yes gene_type:complete
MKKRIAKLAMPLAAILLAMGGAFAGTSGENGDAVADRTGYIKNGVQCTPTAITCSTVFNPQQCSDGINQLYDLNGTSCPLPLYKKVN